MSNNNRGGYYPRDRRDISPARRNTSYNDPPRAPRPRELRDAPPLNTRPPVQDRRDFSPRDGDFRGPRPRSRDGPPPLSSSYSDSSSYRGGFRGDRGRGDYSFRGGRAGRRPDDRDTYSRDRSPPRAYSREDRSPPPRRDDDRYDQRPYRDREPDRFRDAPHAQDNRYQNDAPSLGARINAERAALIEDGNPDLTLRRASTINVPPHMARDEPRRQSHEVPAYLSGRAEATNNKFASRGSSPPAQPPSVPAFGAISFAPVAQAPASVAPKTENRSTVPPRASHEGSNRPRSPPAKAPRTVIADVPPQAPRAPRALEAEQSASRPQNSRSWENLSAAAPPEHPRNPQSTSPLIQSSNRPDIALPTGPKATRTISGTSSSARPPFNDNPYAPSTAPRPRTPPTAPRAHASRSPEMSFNAAPTGPKLDRLPPAAPRAQDRPSIMSRPNDRPPLHAQPRAPPTAPRSQQSGWNLWRRDPAPIVPERRDDRRPDSKTVVQARSPRMSDNKSAIASAADTKLPSSPAKGHSAQQSFFGQPSAEQFDDDMMDDSVSSDDDDDDDDIEVEDLALFEAKFKRKQRELEARLIDLSAREYRSTTPLENLARLTRVTMADVERYKLRDTSMENETSQATRRRPGAALTHSSGSEEATDLPTPTGEEDNSVLIHTEEEAEEDLRRIVRPVPDVITLPYMTRDARNSVELGIDLDELHVAEKTIESEYQLDMDRQDDVKYGLEQQFERLYRMWREECEDLDYIREKEEEIERQMSLEPNPEIDANVAVAGNPLLEGQGGGGGRRLHKFASEYEIEMVMKQSEELARIEQEKANREAKRVQADMEKEAELPDQLLSTEFVAQAFIDENRLRDPESLTVVFAYEPAPDNFTEEEQQIFVAAFKESPKKWTEIASLLPGREPRDCIRHYYANKWDGRFRDTKHRRNKAGRRGRGGKGVRNRGAAMADLDGGVDVPVIMSDSGRPKRAAAPTTFAEKESEAKALLSGQSPAKRAVKTEGGADEKPNKRRKGVPGEKSGRKPAKNGQSLASIAAAPIMSPEARPLQVLPPKEGLDRSRLEEASLLTGFHASRLPMQLDQHNAFPSDRSVYRVEDVRMQNPAVASSSSKAGPSSYWSVPEQGDFMKYIAYFGTDFAAIAAHMGTKTHTMIKNHYQRQIEGSHPGLEESANAANARRQRGEPMGAPPTPTPITKRKYDSAATVTQRPITQGDPMDVDQPVQPALGMHGSPQQFSMRHYPQTTAPTPAAHVGSLFAPQDQSNTPLLAAATPSRPYQALGGRPSVSGAPSYHPPATSQPQQSGRMAQESDNPYIRGLLEEQQRAMRLQGQQQYEDEHPEHRYRSAIPQSTHHSPPASSLRPHHTERRPFDTFRPGPFDPARMQEERSRHLLDPIRFPPPMSNPSPPKREPARPMFPTPAPVTSSVKPEPAKRMDLFSMLNKPEDPKPLRSSFDVSSSAAPRASSPAQSSALAAPPYSTSSKARSDSYGGPPIGTFTSSRQSISHMPAPARSPVPPPSLKQELSGGMSSKKPEWPQRGLSGQGPPLERNVRPYYAHSSSMLNEPSRANPSSPPLSHLHHSRTSSTAEQVGASRFAAPPTSIFASPSYNAGAHPGAPPHHAQGHNGYAGQHQRDLSRGDEHFGRGHVAADRARESEYRYQRDRDEAEARRVSEQRREQELHARGGIQPSVQSAPYGNNRKGYEGSSASAAASSRMLSLREQSEREAAAMQQQAERMRPMYRDERESQPDEARRRHDDAFMPQRRTPLGPGGYQPPLPGSGRR